MAYSLSNKSAKNLCKRAVLVQLIIENVVTFFGTQCRSAKITRQPTKLSARSLKIKCMTINGKHRDEAASNPGTVHR